MSTQYYRRILGYVTPNWKIITLAIFSMVFMAFTLSVFPALILQLLDHTIINNEKEILQHILFPIFILFIVHCTLHFFSNYAVNSVCSELAMNLRIAMFKKLLTLPDNHHSALTTNDVAEKFMADMNKLAHICAQIIPILVKDSLTFIGLFAWMFYLNQELTLITLLAIALMVIIIQLINGFIDHANTEYIQKTKLITNILNYVSSNYKTIRLHSSQLHENDRFTENTNQMIDTHQKYIFTKNLCFFVILIFVIAILSTASYLTIQQAYNNTTTIGGAASFLLAACLLSIPLKQILNIKEHIKLGQQLFEKVFSFLDQESKVETGTITIKRALGELVFDHVSYYKESRVQPLLTNIMLTIRPGETVALVNTTEAIKAALINLMLRFYLPSCGTIRLDGHDLANLDLTSLYTNITFLPKKVPLIDDTIAANIAYGETRCASEAKITAAAQASHAMTFIREMPQGLQTRIGIHGTKLSDSQRHYIGIARTLLKDAPILIIDEIPAMPDNSQEVLQTLTQDRTTLILTQRPSILNFPTRAINLGYEKMTVMGDK